MAPDNYLLTQDPLGLLSKLVPDGSMQQSTWNEYKFIHGLQDQSTLPSASHTIPVNTLINMLNKKNFADEPISICMTQPADGDSPVNRSDHTIYREALPMPCDKSILECRWVNSTGTPAHHFDLLVTGFSFKDGNYTYSAIISALSINDTGVYFDLNEAFCYAEKSPGKRVPVYITISQPHAMAAGMLTSVQDKRLYCKIVHGAPHTFSAISPGATASITIANATGTIFYGKCKIINEYEYNTYELRLHCNGPPRFPARQYRSPRRQMVPAPKICFSHPLSGRPETLDILNLSGSGLAAVSKNEILLPPGMIIPKMTLYFANAFKADITAQIIYKKRDVEDHLIKYGMAILDMDADAHSRYLSLLKMADGGFPMVADVSIDMEDLWSFFFETGFIYSKKYRFIEKNKQRFKKMYQRLYQKNPEFSKHFLLHECGHVIGHLSMLRLYSRSWMMHHHASREAGRMGGIAVLKEAGRFINDSFCIQSMHMDYIICYYRPENKFPQKVFGGLCDKTPASACSEDTFGYFIHAIYQSGCHRTPPCWTLEPTTPKALQALERHYKSTSGGLMIEALDLSTRTHNKATLSDKLKAIGLKREQHLFSLKMGNTLKAIFMINLSDPCLNMSGLAHCVHVFLLNRQGVTENILKSMLTRLLKRFGQSEMPILITARDKAPPPIPPDKYYNLWILNLDYADAYFHHVNRIIRLIKTETTTSIISI
ncbi:MAG: hypothetical protein SWH61_06435 [Thermodesulfobacteriota bacterium]|nr:hypothetical protein [Thermodesulfobacteriota bacterium]